jgi:hypothetical protein
MIRSALKIIGHCLATSQLEAAAEWMRYVWLIVWRLVSIVGLMMILLHGLWFYLVQG